MRSILSNFYYNLSLIVLIIFFIGCQINHSKNEKQFCIYNEYQHKEFNITIANEIFGDFDDSGDFKLIYRFCNKECYKCVVKDLSFLNTLDSAHREHVVVLPNVTNSRAEKIYLNSLIRRLNANPMEGSIHSFTKKELIDHRYFALIDRRGEIHLEYFPDLSNASNQDFINAVLIYFEKKQ